MTEPTGTSITDADDERISCTWCGGEGVAECDDPIQCCDSDCDGEIGPCKSCDGRGYDQWIW